MSAHLEGLLASCIREIDVLKVKAAENEKEHQAEIKQLKGEIDQLMKQEIQHLQSLQVESYQLELGQVAFAGLVCRHVLPQVFSHGNLQELLDFHGRGKRITCNDFG